MRFLAPTGVKQAGKPGATQHLALTAIRRASAAESLGTPFYGVMGVSAVS